MFALKDKYYIYLENTKTLNLNLIKLRGKFAIIYHNKCIPENFKKLNKFRLECKRKNIDFYVANKESLARDCKADGLYISAYNKKNYYKKFKKIIGAAHNFKEIYQKKRQGCDPIILSRILRTDYEFKKGFLGVVRFNKYTHLFNIKFVALGGIRAKNLNVVRSVNVKSIAFLSEVKKKPAVLSRLF